MKQSFHVDSFDKSLLLVVVAIIAVIIQVMDKSFGTTFTLSLGNIFPRADYTGLRFDYSNFYHNTICVD